MNMNDKPVRPDESDCCGSGCRPCIFDIYEERLKKWESNQQNDNRSSALDQIKYLPFLISDIQDLGEVIKIIQFQAVTLKQGHSNAVRIENATEFEILQECLHIKSGEYLILKGVWEGEIISRSYTPILSKDDFKKGAFTIVISLQPNGKMSEFFKKLKTHDIVFWRGPYKEFPNDLTSYKHVLLFGGGTGIVPLYNIAKSVVEDEQSETWVKFSACFRSSDRILLRREFGLLRDFWNFKMCFYITDEKENETLKVKYNERVMCGRIDEAVIEGAVRECGDDEFFVVVCGPQGFNDFIKNCICKLGIKDENIFIFYYSSYLFVTWNYLLGIHNLLSYHSDKFWRLLNSLFEF